MPFNGSTGPRATLRDFWPSTKNMPRRKITRRRLYLEAIREILPKMGDKYIVDAEQRNLLPLLNLGGSKGGQP
jgi:modulator of FtsH protease HflK